MAKSIARKKIRRNLPIYYDFILSLCKMRQGNRLMKSHMPCWYETEMFVE